MNKYLIILSFLSIIHMQHFNVVIEGTGESTLFIFQDSIMSLEIGDELGLFDASGINLNGNTEEVLVGAGIWEGSQLSIAAITSVDLSAFGGPILPGAISGHPMLLKVWDTSSESESNVTYDTSSGSGTFNGLFTAISEINLCDLSEGYCDCEGNILDQCGVCGGPGAIYECGCSGILEGACDCNNNFLDCAGICAGSTIVDECGVCDGPGAVYECGCSDIQDGTCNCEGNVLDECGCCGGPGMPDAMCGCESECGIGDWLIEDMCGTCDDNTLNDCIQDCEGTWGGTAELDECNVCNGLGAIYECGCFGFQLGTCDCDGNVLDECGICDGDGPTYFCEQINTYTCDELECSDLSNQDCYDTDCGYYLYLGLSCEYAMQYGADCTICEDQGYCDSGGGTDGGDDGAGFSSDYESDIEPIFAVNCVECHSYGGGYSGGLDLTSYENLMIGGNSGEAVLPGYSSISLLVQKLNGTASGAQMPLNADPLDNETINLIVAWIDEGAIGPTDDGNGDGCSSSQIADCNGICFDENLLENGMCNDGLDGGANFNCSALYFDGNCFGNFDNCSPDCPVGILELGDISVDIENDLIIGQLEIIMNCQFSVSEFDISLSEDFNITQIVGGSASDSGFNISFEEGLVSANSNDMSLVPGEQSILVLDFETTNDNICFNNSNITTTIGIQYGAVLGNCVPLSSYFEGWNWTSVNQLFDDMSLNYVFSTLGENASFIKSQEGYSDYYPGFGWFGTLETIDNTSMYKLRMINDDAIAFRGSIINVDEVLLSVFAGWNWIGYTPQITVDINTALFNLGENGEFLKSQEGYADFYPGFGWFGTLEEMSPFTGYLLRLTADTDFTYNEGVGLARIAPSFTNTSYDQFDLNIHDYEYNATMTTALYIDDSRVDSYDYILAAYDGLTCVGYTEGLYFPLDGNIIFPLMIYGNEDDKGNTLTFKVYDKLSHTYLDIDKEFVFTPDMRLGDGYNPIVLNNSSMPNKVFLKSVYPNPFNPSTEITYSLDNNIDVKISIYDIQGRLVDNLVNQQQSKGEYSILWSPNNLSSGIYFLKMEAEDYLTTHKLILLK